MFDETHQEPSDQKRVRQLFLERVITLVLTSFGLVIALAWNEAIQALVKTLAPEHEGLVPKFIYAFAITFVFVIISMRLGRLTERP